jgi:isoleucyl-tRNA synthetase
MLYVRIAKFDFKKEQDILDVWFDAEVGHTAVLKKIQTCFSADLFLEGKDQHEVIFRVHYYKYGII